jgi:DNA modification methylase
VTALVLRGDAADLPLPDGSVDLLLCSPPYFGLRSYSDGGEVYDGQIGSEETPKAYIAALLNCTREWIRVLKPAGSIFVNLGDKYSTYTGANWGNGRSLDGYRGQAKVPHDGPVNAPEVYGIPFKSLLGLPWRYALGCVDDLGLTMRAEIIWAKANGMPESATDRVRRSHEQVFHFVKESRGYYAAVDEIREPHQPQSLARTKRNRFAPDLSQTGVGSPNTLNPADACHPLGKLPGSVWEIPSAPLSVPAHLGVDHYAAYPPELCRRIILGWSPAGICTECGEGRRPQVLREIGPDHQGRVGTLHGGDRARLGHATERKMLDGLALRTITGYACRCTPYTDHPERRGKDFHAGTDRARQGMNDGNGGERYRRYVEELANPRGPVREYDFAAWTPPPHSPGARSRSVRRYGDHCSRRRCSWPHRHHRGPLRRLLPPSPLAHDRPRRACPCPRRPEAPASTRRAGLAVRPRGLLTPQAPVPPA